MTNKRYTTLSSVLILLFGLGLFYFGTDGFTAYTAETARVNALIDEQPAFPSVTFEDSNAQEFSISELDGKNVFITFFYTACDTVCPILEMNMGQVYNLMPTEYIGDDIIFLSISFDPERDDPDTLDIYRNNLSADGETWRMARINDQEELDALLEAFGVIVIPVNSGHFAHNSAFYFVNREGNLIDVMDFTEVDEAAEKVINHLENEKGE
ncbi:SCO family protein [Bacillus shivajii]|uniref:SCO family protein n=1 Tax=Bacillus shivajii TaxID=1983719 RepID=UPI001CFA50F5|nr:SCO family protein [Bacillus shivajii]UCZ51432.1 SCO family protein [Bacillus shivajii]